MECRENELTPHIPLHLYSSMHGGFWPGAAVAHARRKRTLEKRGILRLTAYAPELNPVEYIWGYMKQRELPNLCLHTIGELGTFARNRLKSMQRRPQLITAFWKQAELPI